MEPAAAGATAALLAVMERRPAELDRVTLMRAIFAAEKGGADPAAVKRAKALKKRVPFKRDLGGELFECSICLCDKPVSERRSLPCGHVFCPCVRDWLKEHKNCPVCRVKARSSQLLKA